MVRTMRCLAPWIIVGCSGFQSWSRPGMRSGAELGSAVKRANEDVSADVSHRPGQLTSGLQASMAESLLSNGEVLTNPEVSEVIAEANDLAAREAIRNDGVCNRNWTFPCPDGWDGLDESSTCKAPKSYGGACQPLQSFARSSVAEKARFARNCKAPWPCQGDCSLGRDYDTCPKGWTDAGGGFCEDLQDGAGLCMSRYKFDDMPIEQKQELAASCGIDWKCRKACQRDYTRSCPEDWQELDVHICFAPSDYAGNCDYSVNTTGMTDEQKQSFASKCAVRFPCVGELSSVTPSNGMVQGVPQMPSSSDGAIGEGMSNGAVAFDTGKVLSSSSSSKRPQRSAYSMPARFRNRFSAPSGAINSKGEVRSS